VLTNKSSGKQGYALAQAALDAGATVSLVSAQTAMPAPMGAHFIPVSTAQAMLEAVLAESEGTDGLIMAAAVADFRPKKAAENKLKKRDGIPQIELEAAPDVLAVVAAMGPLRPRVVIGFAAESRDLLKNAAGKLKSKKLDMIVANDISGTDSGFGVDTNRVTLLFSDAKEQALPLMHKEEVAETIIAHLARLLETK
jgi:phosphopantothenoylcysteine decarboxylase/phosphopantothenate--cysteine ligase